MRCSKCGTEAIPNKKFCAECGSPLSNRCANCNSDNPPGAKFCADCGSALAGDKPFAGSLSNNHPASDSLAHSPRAYPSKHLADKILQSKSALEGERKQVTVLFADVKGSMDLAERMDPEEWSQIMSRFFQILSEGVERFEGFVDKFTGDGIMALFGAPIAHEDHAQRACYAALRLREEINRYATEVKREHGVGFSTRMGLNSGEVVVGKIGDDLRMDYTAQGHTVGLAQRMESLAEPNTCYLTAATAALVGGYFALEDLNEFRVKGVAVPVRVHRLAGVGAARTRFDISRARGLSRFVGRATDMEALDAALEQARAGNGQVVGIVAEAGTGKSRLCFEFLELCRARGQTVQVGRAVAHGKNIPFLPMLEAFRSYYGITDADSDRFAREKIAGRLLLTDESVRELLPVVFEFFGVPDPQRPAPRMDPEAKQRQLFAVLRKVVREGNVGSQLVALIEDLHWMDAGSEAFLEQWVDATAGSHSLLLVNFRPEYHAAWSSKSYYRQIPLTPLGPEAVRELLDDLLGKDPSIDGLAKAIHERTGGNPFFTEEVVQSLIESGALEGTRGSYRMVRPIERMQVPPTVQALLAARIDRLGEREKQVLQAASVIGKDFAEPILQRVLGEIGRSPLSETDLRAALRALTDAEFIYEQSLYPVAEYAFKHPLTQEVALRSQLQDRRRRTHTAVARALEEAYADRLDETAALLAHHHEEAGEALSAARWHRRAAEWVGLNDIKAALHHWQRVRELARQVGDATESAGLTIVACSQGLAHGWRMGASATQWAELFEEGCTAAERAGDLAALATLNANYSAVRGVNQGIAPDYVRYAREAVRIADRTGDAALRCGTRAYLCFAHAFCGQQRESERVAAEIIELAHEDPHLGTNVAGFSPLPAARFFCLRSAGFMRDPAPLLRELPLVCQAALDSGYPEQALWALAFGADFKYALGSSDGMRAMAQAAARLAGNVSVANEIAAALAQCAAIACDRGWQSLLDVAGDTLRLIRERGAVRAFEPSFLAHIGTAQLELGNLEAGRGAAQEGVVFMRESKCVWSPRSYAVLARAQLDLGEPATDIQRTLDEYAALLERLEFHLFEGELHELRARLADHEGRPAERAAALKRAHDCYIHFGMTAQASRVAEAIG
ncbi:MAG TPA: adenylate/guanylate cyclase domain-containing protein [Candidatus Binataceae bacterium]|nr:adenylate/guanylate cyclase domain-containing protein [Candidatus Binataceae bacterium]